MWFPLRLNVKFHRFLIYGNVYLPLDPMRTGPAWNNHLSGQTTSWHLGWSFQTGFTVQIYFWYNGRCMPQKFSPIPLSPISSLSIHLLTPSSRWTRVWLQTWTIGQLIHSLRFCLAAKSFWKHLFKDHLIHIQCRYNFCRSKRSPFEVHFNVLNVTTSS